MSHLAARDESTASSAVSEALGLYHKFRLSKHCIPFQDEYGNTTVEGISAETQPQLAILKPAGEGEDGAIEVPDLMCYFTKVKHRICLANNLTEEHSANPAFPACFRKDWARCTALASSIREGLLLSWIWLNVKLFTRRFFMKGC